MKKVLMTAVLAITVCGCGGLRFAATEAQKQNAWVHHKTCQLTKQVAQSESASPTVTNLSSLATQQSEAFVLDYGLPAERPAMETVEAVLAEGTVLAQQAGVDAQQRPDVWEMTDAAMELGVGLAGLIGGVYGLRIATFLKQAKDKSKAFKEIVEGNELFKQICPTAAAEFKQAHANQSATTKTLVTEVKTGV